MVSVSLENKPGTPRRVSFADALGETEGWRRILLLGNGFSRAFDESFAYDSLYQRAGTFSEPVAAIFQDHAPDFEAVLEVIHQRQGLAKGPEVQELLRYEAEVKQAFLDAISSVHPNSSHELRRCADLNITNQFLRKFVDSTRPPSDTGKIFTTNYDLLLYWALIISNIQCHDGFESGGNPDFRSWTRDPDRFPGMGYLHGALHIYRHGPVHRMLKYRAGARLIDQVKERLDAREFPLIVAEGMSFQKAERIFNSSYLDRILETFRLSLHQKTVLFTYGHSLGDRDEHILRCVGIRKLPTVYIGAWGGLDSPDGERARIWANRWREQRSALAKPAPLDVAVYDTQEVRVWR